MNRLVTVLVASVALLACSSGSKCVTGQSSACTGPGGCTGFQVCNSDGTFGTCQCGAGDAGNTADSGNPGDAGTDAGTSWTPAQITTLALWLQNGTPYLDGGVVWPDSSPSGNIFRGGVSTSPAIISAALNGKDVLRFTAGMGTALNCPPNNSFMWGTSNFAIAVVGKPGTCSGLCPLWSSQDGNFNPPTIIYASAPDGGLTATGGIAGFDPGTAGTSALIAQGQAHVFVLHRTGASAAEIRVDGVATPFTLGSAVNLSYQAGGILGLFTEQFQNKTYYLDGDIAEVVAATSPSGSELSQLESYLKAKYGL